MARLLTKVVSREQRPERPLSDSFRQSQHSSGDPPAYGRDRDRILRGGVNVLWRREGKLSKFQSRAARAKHRDKAEVLQSIMLDLLNFLVF